MKDNHEEPKSQPSRQKFRGIILHTREELFEMYPDWDRQFIEDLQEFHGLVPLCRKTFRYSVGNLVDAVFNHAVGAVIEPQRNPLTRDEIRKRRKEHVKQKRKT